ncbi:MAG: hypothetical protein HY597_03035 [Candidatus Omnitrophica bacterium]|nr:hypothetical protein [Candidatus Omnitrophota bacterium]
MPPRLAVPAEADLFARYLRALRVKCLTTWWVTPPLVLIALVCRQFGYALPVVTITWLSLSAIGLAAACWIPLPRVSALRRLRAIWMTYVFGISLIETLAIYVTGGLFSAISWLYLLTIVEILMLLSVRAGSWVAVGDSFLFGSLCLLQWSGAVPGPTVMVGAANPFTHPGDVLFQVLGTIALYGMVTATVAWAASRLQSEQQVLHRTQQELLKRSAELEQSIEALVQQRSQLLEKNSALVRAQRSLTEVSSALERRTQELERLKASAGVDQDNGKGDRP